MPLVSSPPPSIKWGGAKYAANQQYPVTWSLGLRLSPVISRTKKIMFSNVDIEPGIYIDKSICTIIYVNVHINRPHRWLSWALAWTLSPWVGPGKPGKRQSLWCQPAPSGGPPTACYPSVRPAIAWLAAIPRLSSERAPLIPPGPRAATYVLHEPVLEPRVRETVGPWAQATFASFPGSQCKVYLPPGNIPSS